MDRKPDKIVALALDNYTADVKVRNLNVRVQRLGNGIRVRLTDVENESRGSTLVLTYSDPADFKINDIDIGEWEKWMEKAENYRTLDNMLAWLKYYDEKEENPSLSFADVVPTECIATDEEIREVNDAIFRADKGSPVAQQELELSLEDVAVEFPVTADMYLHITGFSHQQDDLERCNCKKAGELGHWSCGMCRHGQPVFLCEECFHNSHDLEGRQVNPDMQT